MPANGPLNQVSTAMKPVADITATGVRSVRFVGGESRWPSGDPLRSNSQQMRVRFLLLDQREAKPFADVAGICSLCNELTPQFLNERKHIFPDSVDKHHVGKIDN